ncbi:MAG: bifunctional adenosylcobinamide kinase/adenosylcobinamide-phosphate guanylyltransferase [Cellvibrionaceae bacterium]
MKQLILGGARSGKSNFAQDLALQEHLPLEQRLPVTVIATAEAGDKEMAERIARHQEDRPKGWTTVEAAITLGSALQQADKQKGLILVDCLTLWITNLLLAEKGTLEKEVANLLEILDSINSDIIFVSNETGQGIIPMDPLSRRFVDEAGRLHQQIAKATDRTIYVVAGLPQVLKGPSL